MSEYKDIIKLAYVAGLIDGEGCIGIYRNSHNGNYQLRIAIEMTHEGTIMFLRDTFGGKLYPRPAIPPRRSRIIWMVFGSKAENILRAVLPFLITKKDQATLALELDWQAKTLFKSRPEGTLEKRALACEKMRKLNQRGFYG